MPVGTWQDNVSECIQDRVTITSSFSISNALNLIAGHCRNEIRLGPRRVSVCFPQLQLKRLVTVSSSMYSFHAYN